MLEHDTEIIKIKSTLSKQFQSKHKLYDLASNIEENLQNETPTFINLSCRDYLKNNSCPRKKSMGDVQQSIIKRVARRSDPVMLILRANVCIVKNLALKTKNMQIEKTL